MPRNSIILLSFLLPRANSATLEGTISQSLATKLPLLHSFVRKVLNALDRILRLRLSTDSALMPNLVRVRALRLHCSHAFRTLVSRDLYVYAYVFERVCALIHVFDARARDTASSTGTPQLNTIHARRVQCPAVP